MYIANKVAPVLRMVVLASKCSQIIIISVPGQMVSVSCQCDFVGPQPAAETAVEPYLLSYTFALLLLKNVHYDNVSASDGAVLDVVSAEERGVCHRQ